MAATESKAMHAVRTALAAVMLALIALAPAGLQAQGQPGPWSHGLSVPIAA